MYLKLFVLSLVIPAFLTVSQAASSTAPIAQVGYLQLMPAHSSQPGCYPAHSQILPEKEDMSWSFCTLGTVVTMPRLVALGGAGGVESSPILAPLVPYAVAIAGGFTLGYGIAETAYNLWVNAKDLVNLKVHFEDRNPAARTTSVSALSLPAARFHAEEEIHGEAAPQSTAADTLALRTISRKGEVRAAIQNSPLPDDKKAELKATVNDLDPEKVQNIVSALRSGYAVIPVLIRARVMSSSEAEKALRDKGLGDRAVRVALRAKPKDMRKKVYAPVKIDLRGLGLSKGRKSREASSIREVREQGFGNVDDMNSGFEIKGARQRFFLPHRTPQAD